MALRSVLAGPFSGVYRYSTSVSMSICVIPVTKMADTNNGINMNIFGWHASHCPCLRNIACKHALTFCEIQHNRILPASTSYFVYNNMAFRLPGRSWHSFVHCDIMFSHFILHCIVLKNSHFLSIARCLINTLFVHVCVLYVPLSVCSSPEY
jgi:hypothetical protein